MNIHNPNEPKTINIDASEEKYFKSDLNASGSYLKNFENKDSWLLAFALGFSAGKKKPLVRKASGGFFRTENFDNNYFDTTILKAVAIKELDGDLTIIEDLKTVYSIAEEYANYGVMELKNMTNSPGDFFKKLEEKLLLEKEKMDFER